MSLSALSETCSALAHPKEDRCTRYWPRFFLVSLLRAGSVYLPYYSALLATKGLKAFASRSGLERLATSALTSSLMVSASFTLSGSLMCLVRALLGRHAPRVSFLVTMLAVSLGGRIEHVSRRRELALYWAAQALETLTRLTVARMADISTAQSALVHSLPLLFGSALGALVYARRRSPQHVAKVASVALNALDGGGAKVSVSDSDSAATSAPWTQPWPILKRALSAAMAGYTLQQGAALLSALLRGRSLAVSLTASHGASFAFARFVAALSSLLQILPNLLVALLPAHYASLAQASGAALSGVLTASLWRTHGAVTLAVYWLVRAAEALTLSAQDDGLVSERVVTGAYDLLYALAGATTHYAAFYEPYALPDSFRGFVRKTIDLAHLDDQGRWRNFRVAAGAVVD